MSDISEFRRRVQGVVKADNPDNDLGDRLTDVFAEACNKIGDIEADPLSEYAIDLGVDYKVADKAFVDGAFQSAFFMQ